MNEKYFDKILEKGKLKQRKLVKNDQKWPKNQ